MKPREPYGPAITNRDELLLRNINPGFVHNGQPSSQAFKPTSKDNGLLSVSQSTKRSAEEAFRFFTETLKLESSAVYAVSVGECLEHEVVPHEDPLTTECDGIHDDSHACIDFRSRNNSQTDRVAKRLKKKAIDRGIQYSPPPASTPS